MASDACRGKTEVVDKNLRRTLSNGKEMGKCSPGKEKNIMQLVMESEKAEFRLEMGRKRKKMTACTYRALFKVQRVKTVFLDSDETIEGPDAIVADEVVGESPGTNVLQESLTSIEIETDNRSSNKSFSTVNADSLVSENSTPLPRSRDGTVHSETLEECGDPTDSNEVLVGSEGLSIAVFDNVVGQPSEGNCFEESFMNGLHTNSSSAKNSSSPQEDSTCSARPHNSVVSESDMKCMHPEETRISLECVNGSHPAIHKSTCSKPISISSDSSEDDLCSFNCAVTKDVGRLCTCKKRVQYSKESLCEPNADNTVVENKQRKLVNENVDLESAQVDVNGHRVTQVANCERDAGPSIIAPCDKSQSPTIVKQDVKRGTFNGRGSFELPCVQNEVELKSLGEEHCRSKTDNVILELERKCCKRRKKLQHKQHEKIQEFHKIWDEKREQLDKDNGLENAFIHCMFSEVSVRTERLKCLSEAFLQKIENLKLMKDAELKNLLAEQTAAMNEEKQKVKRWLSTAMLSQC